MMEDLSGKDIRLILASASPRRVELLKAAGFEFEQRPADIDESAHPGESARRYVVRLAEGKARRSWRSGTRSLGADTVVVLDEKMLGKPRDSEHASSMLRRLSGRSHRVLTGVAVFDGHLCRTRCQETVVRFRRLGEREIGEYVLTGEPLDKAGAYAIQGLASPFVESVEGSYTNVVGLPMEAVAEMLR